MKQFYITLTGIFLMALSLTGQNYLLPEEAYKVAYFSPESSTVQTFDVNDRYFYFNDGDTIYQVDPVLGDVSNKYGKPADYTVVAYPSFLSVSPDGAFIWAGYSDLNNDNARIYRVDVASGEWVLEARLPSNWDLVFWNDSILVSGLNSAEITVPNGIFILDTTGSDLHRKLIETGGSSAGIALDAQGNLYFGTSFLSEVNALYRWSNTDIAAVISSPGAAPLQLADAEKLADLPMGVYDCEVDAAGNLIFTMNVWGGTQVLAQWNGTTGAGANYDTLAVSDTWLGMVKSRGAYTIPVPGNSIFTLGYGEAVADLHTSDYPPLQTDPLPVISGYETEALDPIDLMEYFTDLDDPGEMSFELIVMSDASVGNISTEGTMLTGTFGMAGQANLSIEATSSGRTVSGNTVMGTWPDIEGDFLVSDFEDLVLDKENYWNGSDESGQFSTGPARFYNDFSTEFYSWSGWSYSNTTDVSTPGYLNQYSAITGSGFSEDTYGVSSLYGPAVIDFVEEKAHAVEGFFLTNSSYAALSMEQGDWAAKKFGGDDGTDPDYFKLNVWGLAGGESTDTIDYYLADFRFDEPEKDYIIKTWQWVDLSSFGKVDSLMFGLESSDVGEWGMNTPAYFCADNFLVRPDEAPYVANPLPDMNIVTDGYEHVLDLSEVFSDPDDDDSGIVKVLLSGNSECPLAVSISGDELTIQTCMPTKSSFENIEIVVEGSLGGLSAVDTFVIHLEIIGGLENSSMPEVELYPNPSDGRFMIGFGTAEELDVSIFDITGTKVYTNRELLPGEGIDISNQSSGAYIIRIRYSGGVISKMIQKL